MPNKEEIIKSIEDRRDLLIKASDSIWEFAETRFQEYKSSELLCDILRNEAFSVKKGFSDMETAFIASFGTVKPVISFLGEFDALYGLSQVEGVAYQKSLVEGGKGHGCGHNGLGVAALASAIAVKEYIKKNNIQGTVRYYGCPGGESGSGKAYMARDGHFDDIDVALTWHPGSYNGVTVANCLATLQAYFKFYGVSSHAAGSPHLGRSALDAVELMNVGANYLREHIIQDARIHYAMIDGGGLSPNVVQSKASVMYQVRAPKLHQTKEVYDRIVNIAKGAALMTDTRMEVIFDRGSSNLVLNSVLNKLLHDKLLEIGPVSIEEEDIEFAKQIRESLNDYEKTKTEDKVKKIYGQASYEIIGLLADKDIIDIIYPYVMIDLVHPGSTDVGDVSWNAPTAQISTVCYAKDTPGHSWQSVAQGKSKLFHKGVLQAGKVLALAAIDLLENPELIVQAKKEFHQQIAKEAYICPIPFGIKPSPLR